MYRFEQYTIKVPSQHTAVGASSLEQKERHDIVTDEEWYNFDHKTSVMHTVDGFLYVECICMCVHVCLMKNQNAPRPPFLGISQFCCLHIQICVRVCTPGLVF